MKIRFSIGTLILFVACCALLIAFLVQTIRNGLVIHDLRLELVRYTSPVWSCSGDVKAVGDKTAVVFQPEIFASEPGGKYKWWVRVSPRRTPDKPVIMKSFDREIPVPDHVLVNRAQLEMIDQKLPAGDYIFEFGMDLYVDKDGDGRRWHSMGTMDNGNLTVPPTGSGP